MICIVSLHYNYSLQYKITCSVNWGEKHNEVYKQHNSQFASIITIEIEIHCQTACCVDCGVNHHDQTNSTIIRQIVLIVNVIRATIVFHMKSIVSLHVVLIVVWTIRLITNNSIIRHLASIISESTLYMVIWNALQTFK